MKFVAFLLLVILALNTVKAQEPDSVTKSNIHQWNEYRETHQSPGLFLHIDKSIYVKNENIWFTAYLLNKRVDTIVRHTLYVTLTDLSKRRIVAWDRFIMSDGISSGYLLLRDTLPAGEYLLIAYTCENEFQQRISIRSNQKPPFAITVDYLPKTEKFPDSIVIRARVTTDYSGLASGGIFSYNLFADERMMNAGTPKIDAFGEVNIPIPAKDSAARVFLLTAEVIRNKLTKSFWYPFVLDPDEVEVKYYPEGGDVVDNHASRIAIEVRSKAGKAISTEGELLEDGDPVGNFKTDQYGLGILNCIPHKGKKYTVMLKNQPAGALASSHFPNVRPVGFTLKVSDGVVRDSLHIHIDAPQKGSRCFLMIYNRSEIIYVAKVFMPAGWGSIILPAANWPAGITVVTLFDDAGLPVAERTILIPGQKLIVKILTDSSAYHQRSRVKLTVKITNEHGIGIKSVFSFASVLASRLDQSASQDIVRYNQFDLNLPANAEPLPPPSYLDDSAKLDLVLLTRFWTRYRWYEIIKNNKEDIPPVQEIDQGIVRYKNKKIKRPVEMMLMRPSVHLIETDSSGNFQIPHDLLIGMPETTAMLTVVNEKNQDNYEIEMKNNYDSVNRLLANTWFVGNRLISDTRNTEEQGTGEIFNQATELKEVVVKAKSKVDVYTSFSCDDYVCLNGVLNCPNHPFDKFGGTRPVWGNTYLYNRHSVVYKGSCFQPDPIGTTGFRAIHITKQFYAPDYSKINPAGPVTFTTIFWAPLTITNENGEASITFYTNDKTGEFVNIIQGINRFGVFSGKTKFIVKE